MNILEWIGIISGILGIISFFLPEGKNKIKGFLLLFVFLIIFILGYSSNEKEKSDNSKVVIEASPQKTEFISSNEKLIDKAFENILVAKKITSYSIPPIPTKISAGYEYEFDDIQVVLKKYLSNGDLLVVFKITKNGVHSEPACIEVVIFSNDNTEIKYRQEAVQMIGHYGDVDGPFEYHDIGIPSVSIFNTFNAQGAWEKNMVILALVGKTIKNIAPNEGFITIAASGVNYNSLASDENNNYYKYTEYEGKYQFLDSKTNGISDLKISLRDLTPNEIIKKYPGYIRSEVKIETLQPNINSGDKLYKFDLKEQKYIEYQY